VKKHAISQFILQAVCLLLLVQSSFGAKKVLFIVEENCLSNIQYQLNACLDDISFYDYKKYEVISWPLPQEGSSVFMCTPLWQRLQDEYFEALNSGDVLEGAVLIGNVPVPITADLEEDYLPFDYAYMDIVDTRSGVPVRYGASPFIANVGGYYSPLSYGAITPGDQQFDIWVSRINASYLDGLRQGNMNYDEYNIYRMYLNRMNARMTQPATVPSRGFAVGGPENLSGLDGVLGTMRNLGLPWFVEFTGAGGNNSPFNWASQLLAGPYGTITYGAFNGTVFPNERNARACRFTQLQAYLNGATTTSAVTTTNDSLGWDWAGLYNHSCPTHTNFYEGYGAFALNGTFGAFNLGPFFGTNYRRTDGGWKGGYHCYFDDPANPNPGNWNSGTKAKMVQFRWPITSTRTYNVYIYYTANPGNDTHVYATLQLSPITGGVPSGYSSSFNAVIDQTRHVAGEGNWELAFQNVSLAQGQMAIVQLDFNHDEINVVNRIADAVRFRSIETPTPAVDVDVDDMEPVSYASTPDAVFSTKGFFTNDAVNRNYEELGSEPGGGGLIKPQFYLTCACNLGKFTVAKNNANLYALGHNGLICMSAATSDWSYNDKTPYVAALSEGLDFGEAYLRKQNASFWSGWTYLIEVLLGAGTLYAHPYVEFGSVIEESKTITTATTRTTNSPVLIRDVTVNGAGSWHVTSTYNATSSPKCTHSEIVVRQETHFAPTGTNEVHLLAN
jgi:hypothetical protein